MYRVHISKQSGAVHALRYQEKQSQIGHTYKGYMRRIHISASYIAHRFFGMWLICENLRSRLLHAYTVLVYLLPLRPVHSFGNLLLAKRSEPFIFT